MNTLARSLVLASVFATASLTVPFAEAAPGHGGNDGGSFSGRGGHGGGAFNGSGSRGGFGHGGYRGGYYGGHYGHHYGGYRGNYWGHRGYWGPGAVWGGIGLGIGLGAIAYSTYDRGYYGGYRVFSGDDYDGFYDAPEVLVVPTRPAYVAVDPPIEGRVVRSGQPVPQQARPVEPIFYPRNGQTAAALENDRRDCNRWATTQQGALVDASVFQRATYACMDGRGYTVR
ncbi:MAG: hypothetical protein ABI281_03545 [Caldimonas sp.]